MKGYGRLIADARTAKGLSAEDLARRLGRTRTFVYRIEGEETEPTIEQVNALASILPLSVEDILTHMGASLHSPAITRLPVSLVEVLLQLDPAGLQVVEATALGQLLLQRRQRETAGRS